MNPCVATLAEIRAKDGNLSIPLYVNGSSAAMEASEATASYTLNGSDGSDRLTEALTAWLESSRQVRESLKTILEVKP